MTNYDIYGIIVVVSKKGLSYMTNIILSYHNFAGTLCAVREDVWKSEVLLKSYTKSLDGVFHIALCCLAVDERLPLYVITQVGKSASEVDTSKSGKHVAFTQDYKEFEDKVKSSTTSLINNDIAAFVGNIFSLENIVSQPVVNSSIQFCIAQSGAEQETFFSMFDTPVEGKQVFQLYYDCVGKVRWGK